jgi:hypothetical protein
MTSNGFGNSILETKYLKKSSGENFMLFKIKIFSEQLEKKIMYSNSNFIYQRIDRDTIIAVFVSRTSVHN